MVMFYDDFWQFILIFRFLQKVYFYEYLIIIFYEL